MKNRGMNRRGFIKATGATSILLLGGLSTAAFALKPANPRLTKDAQIELNNSIKAHFGTGFEIVSQSYHGDQLMVEIEHLENRYWVQSRNSTDWQIVQSTIQ